MNITPSRWVYLLFGVLVVSLIYLIYTTSPNKSILNSNKLKIRSDASCSNISYNDETIKELSLLLNQASNNIGKLSCKISDDVSANGGWCSKISGRNSSQHATDTVLALELSKYLKGKRVASFGDGPGK